MENAIGQLLEEAGKILADRKQETQSGKCFNCIDICGVGTIETRHTEIIATLLDPQGNHGFGAESLKAFFRACGLTEFSDHCEDCCVRTEAKIPGRRPDIVISGKDLCVVIENKTNTNDHYMQLADYRDWVEGQKVTYHALLYLTYRGYKAVDTNIKEAEYTRISYTETICKWLEKCAGMQRTPAADFCKQYANFINANIMKGSVMSTREEIKVLLDSPEKIKAAEELAIVVEDVKNQKYIDLFNEWAEKSGKNTAFTFSSKKNPPAGLEMVAYNIYNLKSGDVSEAVPGQDAVTVALLVKRTPADMKEFAASRMQYEAMCRSRKAAAAMASFEEELSAQCQMDAKAFQQQ